MDYNHFMNCRITLVIFTFLFFNSLLGAAEIEESYHAIPFFEEMTRDETNRMEQTAQISADGSKIVYVNQCSQDTSLSGLLGSDGAEANQGSIYVYDVASQTATKVFQGQFSNRSGGGIQYLDAFISADITADGTTVVAAVLTISLSSTGESTYDLSRACRILKVDIASQSITDVAQVPVSGYGGLNIQIRTSSDGSRALFCAYPPNGESNYTWGVTYPSYYDKYELYTVNLLGDTPVMVTDATDDYELGTYGGVRYSFDINADGTKIVFSQVGDASGKTHVVTANADGSGQMAIASDLNHGEHVAISGDGARVAYCDWGPSSSGDDERVYVNDHTGGNELTVLNGGRSQIGMLSMSSNGDAVVLGNGLGGDRWFYGCVYICADGVTDPASLLNKAPLSATADLRTLIQQNDDSPIYLNSISIVGGGGGDDAYEENDSLGTAYVFDQEGTWLSAVQGLGVQTDEDFFQIHLDAGESVQIDCTFTHSEGDIDLALYDSNETLVGDGSASESDNEQVEATASSTGYYYIRVFYGNAGNAYDLRWQRAGGGDDAYEENDSLGTAYVFDQEGTWLSAVQGLGVQSDQDWFRIHLNQGESVQIDCTFSHSAGDIDLELYSSDADPVGDSSASESDDERLEETAPSTGYYYIRVYYGDAGNTYDLRWQTDSVATTWEPQGWVYFTWPYAYSFTEGRWRFFNTADRQWRVDLSNGAWGELADATGWNYYNWPYSYSTDESTWHWYNADTQWVVDLISGVWARLGESGD